MGVNKFAKLLIPLMLAMAPMPARIPAMSAVSRSTALRTSMT